MNKDTKAFNTAQEGQHREICQLLASEIVKGLPEAENRIWHGSPTWFLDGNPIVAYNALKDSIRLLFWSGQSFDEHGLHPEGKFKAAEVRYTSPNQLKPADLQRWLEKSKSIQWDYKNIVKRRGELERIP